MLDVEEGGEERMAGHVNDDHLAALSGVRVADFSAVVAGPYCTRLMADSGADVVKIKPPGGDHLRTVPPVRDGCSAYFGVMNAGKRSVVLDLGSDVGVFRHECGRSRRYDQGVLVVGQRFEARGPGG